MTTLVIYYSKTGTTQTVAQAVAEKLQCEKAALEYKEQEKTVTGPSPAGYDRVILLCPIWAFSLAEPMKLYLAKHHAEIKNYDLIVTCGKLGLRGCVRGCTKAIGRPPKKAVKFKAEHVNQGQFDLGFVDDLK